MRDELLQQIIARLVRKDKATIIWSVREAYDIRDVVMQFAKFTEFEYNASQRILKFAGIKVIFITEDCRQDRLCGLMIDEVIVDET